MVLFDFWAMGILSSGHAPVALVLFVDKPDCPEMVLFEEAELHPAMNKNTNKIFYFISKANNLLRLLPRALKLEITNTKWQFT
jgi:hypothetical protein